MWHSCCGRISEKFELLNEQVLRVVLYDPFSTNDMLLSKVGMTSLLNRRIQDMLILGYMCLPNMAPVYLSTLFHLPSCSYSLRGVNKLAIPQVKTPTYGLNSFRYLAANPWNNDINDEARGAATLTNFKQLVRYISF